MRLADNKKAFHLYEILQEFEAGIVLTGPEVKSVRDHRIDIKHSFVKIESDEAYIVNAHISPYSHARVEDYEPKRNRKLLLRKKEIGYLEKKTEEKGLTLVPLQVYTKRGLIKIKIALARGKRKQDKREDLKRKISRQEIERERKKYI